MATKEVVCRKCEWAKIHNRKEVDCPRQGWIKLNGRDSAFSYGGAGVCTWNESEGEVTAEATETKTLAEIVAELRSLVKCAEHFIHPRDDLPTVFGKPIMVYFADLTNQIEVTAKRAYHEIDTAVCAIDDATSADIDDVRRAMENTIGEYYE